MIGLVAVPVSLVLSSEPLYSQTIQNSRSDRWLEVEQVYGDVELRGTSSRDAQVGDRLSQVGEGIDQV